MKLFGRAAKEGVSPGLLWEQHNEHRIVIANSVFFAVRRLGGWVVLAPHIVSALMMATTIGVFTTTILRLKFRPVMVALAVATALTPLQWENTIWGFQVQFVALALGVIVPLCLLANRPVLGRRALVISLTAGFWCTGTIGSGLLAWGVFGFVTLFLLKGDSRIRHSSIIGISALTVGIVYLIGWKRPSVTQAEGPSEVVTWIARGLTFPLSGTGGGWKSCFANRSRKTGSVTSLMRCCQRYVGTQRPRELHGLKVRSTRTTLRQKTRGRRSTAQTHKPGHFYLSPSR
jgi:hypothetical protein